MNKKHEQTFHQKGPIDDKLVHVKLSGSWAIRKMKIKITMKHHCKTIKIQKNKC